MNFMKEKNIGNVTCIKKLIIGCCISWMISIIGLVIYAAILVNTNIQENTINIVVIAITGISIFGGGIISSKKIKNRGIINGICVGVIYFSILYVLSSILYGNFSLNWYSILMIICGGIVGGIGGIIGVNMKK